MKRLVAMLLFATPVATAAEQRVTTRSGDPEILLLGRDVIDARGQMAYVCGKLGWKASAAKTRGVLSCDVPTTNMVSVLATGSEQLLDLGNWTKVPVRRVVRFHFQPAERGVVVRAEAERMIPAANNMFRYERQPIDDPSTFNGLLNVIALAGNATFAPGTTFARVGYLGFRSDRFAEVDLAGRKRTAIQVGMVEADSPAEAAGLKSGDFVLTMNGRDFADYREVSKYLSAIEPGTEVAMLVERGRDRLDLSATATTPPPLAADP